jgi:YggT family protein
LSQITDPYLNLFRSIIPPLGGMDFSPMIAILLLQFLGNGLQAFR